jgi:hypothetical protein
MLAGSFGLFFLRLIPFRADLFDLRRLPEIPLRLLVAWPIRLFDFLTAHRFAPHGEGFLVFPDTPQLLFAFAFDVTVFYLLACTITAWRSRNSAVGCA